MIPYGKQSITDEDIQAVADSLRGDFLTTGPLVVQFEEELERQFAAPAISVSSGTAALHCAYAAIGIKAGDEIITPPITFIATQATAAILGAKIVFADVEEETANIDPSAVEAAITNRTKAIVAVDYAGHPADMHELRSIADKYGVFLIEDAAHSAGSLYKGKPVGSLADLTTFSFFPTKNLTTAEGGAICSTNKVLLDRVRRFARQGLVRNPEDFKITTEGLWHQEVHEFGLNYRLPDVLCALGIQQIRRMQVFKAKRREIFENYVTGLKSLKDVRLPIEKVNVEANWHLFPMRVPAEVRLAVFNQLRENGVGVQVNYLPAYRHPVFESYQINRSNFPNSERFYSEEISLPMYSDLTTKDQNSVIEVIRKVLT
jgi:dTDP-4-amino-4,6-dideoxygalactose transaminase